MCELYDGDLETAKVWRETPRTAAKTHDCAGCRGRIVRGEPYVEHVSILDSVSRERMCFPCWWARDDFHQTHGGPQIMPSMLEEFLRECARDNTASEERWTPYLVAMEARRAAA